MPGISAIGREAGDLLLLDDGPIDFHRRPRLGAARRRRARRALDPRDRVRASSGRWRRPAASRIPTCAALRPGSFADTARTRSRSSSSAATRTTSSRRTGARFVGYRIENRRAARLRRPGRPGRRAAGPRPRGCAASPRRTASSSASSAPASACCRCGARPDCARSTSETRRSWTRGRSRSRAGRSARCASPCRGSRRPATRRSSCDLARARRADARRARPRLERAGATALPSAASRWRWTRSAARSAATRRRRARGTRTGAIARLHPLRAHATAARPCPSRLMRRDRDTPNGLMEFLVVQLDRAAPRRAASTRSR